MINVQRNPHCPFLYLDQELTGGSILVAVETHIVVGACLVSLHIVIYAGTLGLL